MRLLTILLLCSHCLLGSATIIDDDCNDQNVFGAVDEALRSFNNAKEDGNLFVLYRVTDAKKQNDEDQIHHFVEYETHESSCEVRSGKSWQECSSTYSYQVKCSAHVLFNKDLKVRSVESQNCSSPEGEPPVTAVHHQCLGCFQPVDIENKELLCFVQSTIEQVNREADNSFYFDLESIVNATRQVTYGWQYNIHFLIGQTNCSKFHFASKDSKECKIEKGGEPIACTAEVYVNPEGKANDPTVECKTDTGVCINCPLLVDPKDPELLTLLRQVMDEYNFNSNHTILYDVTDVEKAERTGFKRQLYKVTYRIGPTNCSKPDYSILGDDCALTHDSPGLTCDTTINVTDKTFNVHSAPHCHQAQVQFGIRIGGLSPLRRSRSNNDEENDRNSMLKLFKQERARQGRHEHNNKRHKHGKKGKKDKEGKNTQHEDSSEEEKEDEVTQPPLQITNPAIQPEMSPNTDVVPRCPGRVWEPKSSPTDKTFSLDDLMLAADNVTPTSAPDVPNNAAFTPKQNTFFDDADLLD